MNERIRELAEQAFDAANDGSINNIKIPKEFVEKFAELIVKECMKVSNMSLSKYELPSDKIAEHFGVE